jgi:RHS repeat-associated protein
LGALVAGYTYYGGLDNVASALRHDRGDSTYYYLQDYSGNVVALLGHNGSGNSIDNQYRYEPFGNTQANSPSSVPNSMQFAGREYDAETQLYYDRARYLDPSVGRFISEDPIGLAGGMNLYAFVGNDPVNVSDPSGEKASAEVELCGGYQEPFAFAAEHLGSGWLLTHWGFLRRQVKKWFHLTPVSAAFTAGIIHEGPWWDGDLTRSEGAPCNGIGDIFLFMVLPLANTWGWSGPVVSTQYPWVPSVPGGNGSPIPGFPGSGFPWPGALPPTIWTGVPQGPIL